MASETQILATGREAEQFIEGARVVAVYSIMPNKANFRRFWPENKGHLKNKANSAAFPTSGIECPQNVR